MFQGWTSTEGGSVVSECSPLTGNRVSALNTTKEGSIVSACSPMTGNRSSCFRAEHNKREQHRLCMQPLDRKPLFMFQGWISTAHARAAERRCAGAVLFVTLWASAVSIASERKTGERNTGKVQGDGRKFLDRLKSYFGLQISSQSLNESTDYSQKPQQKVILFCFDFFIIFCSYIFIFDCQFESAHVALWRLT